MIVKAFARAIVTAMAGLWIATLARAADVPVVAAASDLQFALTDAARQFTDETGGEVKLTFGSSGNLARQIQGGAPFELFLSADEKLAIDLAAKGLAVDEGEIYGVGRIVLIVPKGSPIKADASLADLAAAAVDGRLKRLAIANPEHAPYGRRAEEALRHAGLWEAIRDRLVLGENVSQAAQFATSGNAEAGIIAYSLSLSPNVASEGSFALIPEDWHEPLRQRMVLLKDHGETASQFYEFLKGAGGRSILKRYGFALPGEPVM